MNLLALRNKVIEKLKERSTPKHWSVTEINDNINRGCRKFAGDSMARELRLPLYAVDIANGLFDFPNKLLKKSAVYWDGIKLDFVSSDYLDNLLSANPQSMVIGSSVNPISNWRGHTADAPTKWLIEDGRIRVYPLPNSMTSAVSIRQVQEANFAIGDTDIVFTGPLPTNQDLIDVYLNGVYQNKTDWTIVNSTTIRFPAALMFSGTCETVFFDGVTSANTNTHKYDIPMTMGQSVIFMPRPYIVGDNAISLKINGVSQAPSAFTESSAYSVTSDSAVLSSSVAEVTIYERVGAFQATMKCVIMPSDMVNDTDVPDLPGHLENFHDALWQWALSECYSREGQEKNMSMAAFYGSAYDSTLKDYKETFGTPVLITPRDAWRI